MEQTFASQPHYCDGQKSCIHQEPNNYASRYHVILYFMNDNSKMKCTSQVGTHYPSTIHQLYVFTAISGIHFSKHNLTSNVKIHGLPFISDTMLLGKK